MEAERGPVGARRGRWRRAVPAAMMGAGALAMMVGFLAPSASAQTPESITAALSAYTSNTVTIQLTPIASSPNGAWVSIMNPTSGATYTHAFVNQALVAGKSTTVTVPITLPGGTLLPGFSSFLEIPSSGNQAVVLAAETQPTGSVPIPVPPPSPSGGNRLSTPPIPSTPPTTYTQVPPTKTGASTPTVPVPSVPATRTVTLPKTGAGPWLEIGGVLLFLAGGFLLVLRPRRA